jgi:hypothetical protein
MGGHRSKNGHRSGCDQCYKSYISFFILGLLRPSSWLRRGFFYLRKSSGSLAMFAAMRRASFLLSNLAADRRPGASSK